jgi:hypothetical protein
MKNQKNICFGFAEDPQGLTKYIKLWNSTTFQKTNFYFCRDNGQNM